MYYPNPELMLELVRLERAQRERALERARLIDEARVDRSHLAERLLASAGGALIDLGERLKARAEAGSLDYVSECS